jgi:hypothetical protein
VLGLDYIFKLAATGKGIALYLASSAWRTLVTRKYAPFSITTFFSFIELSLESFI